MRIANHTHPTTSIVAFCPDCLTYGTPLGPDVQCGNCNGTKCRLYREFEEFKELGRMLPFPQPQPHEKDTRIAELEAEVLRLKDMHKAKWIEAYSRICSDDVRGLDDKERSLFHEALIDSVKICPLTTEEGEG